MFIRTNAIHFSKFKTYDAFARASVNEILEGRMDGTVVKEATEFHSIALINKGNNSFEQVNLPADAQIAPVYSIAFLISTKMGLMTFSWVETILTEKWKLHAMMQALVKY